VRYFTEAFTLPGVTPDQIKARVRVVNEHGVFARFAKGESVVAALGHLGNWDLAGAWSAQNMAPVLTVAEKLKPEAVFKEFLKFRAGIGIEALGLGDTDVVSTLVERATTTATLVPLLADRDLTSRGVEVQLFGQSARIAAGPAVVALRAELPVCPILISYERLHGKRRKAARSPWGIVITFGELISAPGVELNPRAAAAIMMQSWADQLADYLTKHTEDWHMMQKVFVTDLDPSRLTKV
jgi:KDO2-lipid IV(A) lauroyltransferase